MTLVLDLANQMNPCLDVFMFLMKTQRVREAKRYLKANHERIAVPETMKAATLIKDEFMRKEYIKFVKFFIPQKFPTMSLTYLE